jgi:hypothetical protein
VVDNKVYLVVMVAYLDAPLAIQNILEVLVVLVDLNRFLLNLIADKQKIIFTSQGISSCKLTTFVPLGVCSLDLIPTIVLTNIEINKTSIIVIIN